MLQKKTRNRYTKMATTTSTSKPISGKNKRFFHYLIPSLVGILLGLAGYIFYISKAHSYLSDDPKACVNCHIMAPEYATWFHSSHGRNAVCNDCHVPHDNFFRKYYFKASDGLRHATMFTFRMEPQVIKMHAPGQMVVQENCIRCHNQLNSQVRTGKVTSEMAHKDEGRLCWECHREVPHSRVRGLSTVPDAQVPIQEDPIPEWLQNMVKKGQKQE